MGIERFPWLNDAKRAHQNIAFPSSSIIEGESGLAKKQLAKYFAQKLLCSDEFAPCGVCNSCNYFLAESHPDYCFLIMINVLACFIYIPKPRKRL